MQMMSNPSQIREIFVPVANDKDVPEVCFDCSFDTDVLRMEPLKFWIDFLDVPF